MFRTQCPYCQAALKSTMLPRAGKRLTCLKCGQSFAAPGETCPPTQHLSSESSLAVSGESLADPPAGFSSGPQTPIVVLTGRYRKSLAGFLAALTGLVLFLGGGVVLGIFLLTGSQEDLFPPPATLPDIRNPIVIAKELPEQPPLDPLFEKKLAREKGPHTTKDPPPRPSWPLGPLAGVKPEKINQAIEKGVAYLKKSLPSSGSWMGPSYPHEVGAAALSALALVECQVPRDDPALLRAGNFVRSKAALLDLTYDLGMTILFLDRLGDPQDRELIQKLALRLVAGQGPQGGWNYKCPDLDPADSRALLIFLEKNRRRYDLELQDLISADSLAGKKSSPRVEKEDILDPLQEPKNKKRPGNKAKPAAKKGQDLPAVFKWELRRLQQKYQNLQAKKERDLPAVFKPQNKAGALEWPEREDNSNTQFGLLGLWASRRHGIPTELPLERTARHFQNTQNSDGGWSYVSQNPSKNTMTCVGLLGLAMGHGGAAETLAKLRKERKLPQSFKEDPAIQGGLNSLEQYVQPDESRFGLEGRVELYFLWTLERTCLLYGLERVGKKDWYRWGALFILERQGAAGSWQVHYEPPIDTALALLFLKRANPFQDLSDKLPLYLAIPQGETLHTRSRE